MTLALIGVVLAPMGWLVSETIFINEQVLQDSPYLGEVAEVNRSPHQGLFLASKIPENNFSILGTQISGPRLVFQRTLHPFVAIFGGSCSAREFWYYLLGSLWSILVWSYIGVGIVRISLLRMTRDERAGLDDAFQFANEKSLTAMLAVAMPLLTVLVLCLPTFLIGLLMGFDFGAWIVGMFWFVVLALSAVMGVLLMGLMFGWPLIVASVAAEGQNAFDAMTRAYAYTFQRPIHYLFYAIIAILFGGFCWIVASQLTEGVVNLSYWSTSWGANRTAVNRIDYIRDKEFNPLGDSLTIEPRLGADLAATPEPNQVTPNVESESNSTMLDSARWWIGFWTGCAKTIAAAFLYGLFWCMAGAIYLLLRHDVDETEMDEIFVVDERRTYELPPLRSDEDGIPQIQPLAAKPASNSDAEAADPSSDQVE